MVARRRRPGKRPVVELRWAVDCAGCMAGAVGCLTDECLLDCLGGPDSAGCIACAEEACGDDFETCSGLPLPI